MTSAKHFVSVRAALSALALLVSGSAQAGSVGSTAISLPQGPASVEGLGRNFVPSLASGTAAYSVDITVPPAVRGFGPSLSLDYDGGGGASEIGIGWHLGGLPAIRRRVDDGLPRFDGSDTFELSGIGMPSDLLEVEPGIFRPEHESGAFARVEQGSDDRWLTRSKSGQSYLFGGEGYTEQEGGNVATYLLREQQDLHGHSVRYEWDTSEGHALLRAITWNDFSAATRIQVALSYSERPDVYERFSSGIRQVISRRLSVIEVTYGGELVRRYTLAYSEGAHSKLSSVELVGSDGETRLPALSFAYTQPSFAGDGQVLTMANAPGRSPSEANVALTDLDGDSLPDLLVTEPGAYRSYLNQDGLRWNPAEDWAPADSPAVTLASTGAQLADVDGDGAIDLLVKSGAGSFRYLPGLGARSFSPAVSIASVPSFSFEDPDVRLADMDGDRRSDVLITTAAGLAIGYNQSGHDWALPEAIGTVDPAQPLRFSDGGRTSLCDINGDRVQDFCALRSESLVYWLGRGRGRFEPARTASGVPAFDAASPWEIRDIDGDGWADLVHVGVTQIEYTLAHAAGSFGQARALRGVPERGPGVSVTFADMNGSGTQDIVWIEPSAAGASWRYLELVPQGRAGLLRSIDNGLGKLVRIRYEAAALSAARARDNGKPWATRMNVAMPVVQRVEVDSSLGDPLQVSEYTYRDGSWDAQECTFAGFAGGLTKELGDEHTPTLLVEDTFDTGLGERVLRGAPLSREQRAENGAVFSRTTYGYTSLNLGAALDGRSIHYAYRASERVEHVEASAGAAPRVTLSEWRHDTYGNVIEEKRWGEVSGGDVLAGNDEAITRRTYANDAKRWLLGYIASEQLEDAAGQRYRARRWYYDGEPFQGLSLGQVSHGDVSRQELWIGPDPNAFVLDVATRYNEHGQPLETRDARGGGRLFTWKAADPASLQSESVKLDTGIELIEVAEIDPRFGNLLSIREYNGQTTHFQYDALGRLSAVAKPGDDTQAPTLRYAYLLQAPLSRVITESRAGAESPAANAPAAIERSEAVFDGLGRRRASLTQAEDEQWVLAGVGLLDARGNARRSLRPRYIRESAVASPPLLEDAAGASSWRDALGRTLRTRSELGIESRSEYAPLATRSWDGAQADPRSPYEHTPTLEAVDGLGRTIRASQSLNGRELAAHFAFDAAGQLRQKTDPEGNVARYGYDGRGSRTLVDDPDLGRRVLAYDDLGNLIERSNPDGNVLRYSFDLAGRPVTEDWDGDGTPEVVKTWDVDPSHPADLRYRGKLAHIEEPTGATEHEYDERGRITTTSVTIDGARYESGSRFDNLDREVLHIYPDGSSIGIQRNARGQLAGYGAGAVSIAYAGDGLESERRFSTGVLQQSAYDADGRLGEIKALDTSGNTIEHLKWTFDAAGNVTSLQDLRGSAAREALRSEAYTYDNLYRLRAASGTWGEAQWAYSPSGNLTSRSSSAPGQTATEIRYQGAGPHAPSSIGARTLQYDALGRMLQDGDRTYTWNSADQLTHVTSAQGASIENQFDANGIRRVRTETDADGNTTRVHFISPWSEVHDGKLARYIVHTERRIVRLSESNGAPAAIAAPHGAERSAPRALVRLQALLPLVQSGALWLLLTALLALFWRMPRPPARALRVFAPLAALAIVAACAADNDGTVDSVSANAPAVDRAGSVRTLSEADTLLINDALGSLLAETSGSGQVQARFAAYPYGVTRQDTTSETRRYAGATRDTSVGLDLMGARFYAPDLGIWTVGDPIAITNPERSATAQFGTANPYAYANLNPVTATDPDGEFWHIAIGAGIGAIYGGGIEAARQYYASGRIEDWGRVGAAAGGGAVSGAIQAALPGVGTVAVMAVGGASGAVDGLTQRLIASGGSDAGTLTEVVIDVTVGAASAGIVRGATAMVKRAIAARPAAAQVRRLDSEAAFKSQYGQLGSSAQRSNRGLGDAIAGGHAFDKHVVKRGEFEALGIQTPREFAAHIDHVVANASGDNIRHLSRGRTAFWDDASGTVVIHNPSASDLGTAFRPTDGRKYLNTLK